MTLYIETAWLGQHNYENNTLRSGFYQKKSDSPHYLVSFHGEANITIEGLCDLADIHGNEPFINGYMLHFIAEFSGIEAKESVLIQRRFITLVRDYLQENNEGVILTQGGDDLYYEGRKLSVSIVAPSTQSTYLMHAAFNIDNSATLNVASLSEIYNINKLEESKCQQIAKDLMEKFNEEMLSIINATRKVKPIGLEGHLDNIETLLEKKPDLQVSKVIKGFLQLIKMRNEDFHIYYSAIHQVNTQFIRSKDIAIAAENAKTVRVIRSIWEHICLTLLGDYPNSTV